MVFAFVCGPDRGGHCCRAVAVRVVNVWQLDSSLRFAAQDAAVGSMTSTGGEELCRHQRLRHRVDFQRCYRKGRRKHGSVATLHFHPNEQQEARLGITASRKVGKAVVRHRIKRRIREIFRRFEHRSSLPKMDIVVHLRPGTGGTDFQTLQKEISTLLGSLVQRAASRR